GEHAADALAAGADLLDLRILIPAEVRGAAVAPHGRQTTAEAVVVELDRQAVGARGPHELVEAVVLVAPRAEDVVRATRDEPAGGVPREARRLVLHDTARPCGGRGASRDRRAARVVPPALARAEPVDGEGAAVHVELVGAAAGGGVGDLGDHAGA